MTDIERAEADGVDKGIAMDPGRPAAPGRRAEADERIVRDPTSTAADPESPRSAAPTHERRGVLVPTGEREELEGRLRHALTGFVDEPRASVEEADHVLEDLTARLAETLASHRRTLRTSWQGSTQDTEQLRQALRDYRETAERLLRL
ncbi:hypothetical protein [Streptomyces sp. NPDC051684]|uniref:hypothetical protein n=1 Tax=Streptomyces sp. NPDC051684 TaxID=3365670 RepID=UPI0037A703DB